MAFKSGGSWCWGKVVIFFLKFGFEKLKFVRPPRGLIEENSPDKLGFIRNTLAPGQFWHLKAKYSPQKHSVCPMVPVIEKWFDRIQNIVPFKHTQGFKKKSQTHIYGVLLLKLLLPHDPPPPAGT